MNNVVATQFDNFDKLYKNVPAKGLANLAEENGPLNNLVNSMVNVNIANNRYDFIKTILERTDNPYSLGSLMLDQTKYNALPDPIKGIVIDVFSKLLNYKDPNNTDATIRASIDFRLLENATRINYNDINFVGSGDTVADIKALIESLIDLCSISKPLLNDSTGAVGPMFDMLAILKNSGNMSAYNLALDLLNKNETFALVQKVITKLVPLASKLQFAMGPQSIATSASNVAVNRNLVSNMGTTNMSVDAMLSTMINTLVNIVNPMVQTNLPNIFPMISYCTQSIPQLLQLDVVRTFNTLMGLEIGSPISPADRMAIEVAYGKYKAIFGPDSPITRDLRISIAFGYLAGKLVEVVQSSNGKLNPDIANAIMQYVMVLNLIAYGQDATNVAPVKLELADAVVADIQAGKPFFTLGLYGGNALIENAAKSLFIINPTNGQPLLSPKNIIESAGTAYTGNVNQGVNFIMVRTYLEKIPQLKPYTNNVQSLDELAQAITSALVRLQINA